MKKKYFSPGLVVVNIAVKSAMLQLSVNSKELSNRSNAGLAREDKSWDIWGNDDVE